MSDFDGVINPAAGWPDIPELSTTAIALGGPTGAMNAQAIALAARTNQLQYITTHITINVPADYPTIADALSYLEGKVIVGGGYVTVKIADGNYNISMLSPRIPFGSRVEVIGNTTTPSNVVLILNNNGNNACGFQLINGFSLAKIDGLTILGSGGQTSHGHWASQSYGAGVFVSDGGTVTVGGSVIVNKMYYGIQARHSAHITCNAGVSVTEAGDCGFHAFGATMIAAQCTATNTADYDAGLGFGFCAENGGNLEAELSTSSNNAEAGFYALANGTLWAFGTTTNNNEKDGYRVLSEGYLSAEKNGSTHSVSNNNGRHGYYCQNGWLLANSATTDSNAGCGFYAVDGGKIDITVAQSSNNQQSGFKAFNKAELIGDAAVATNNTLDGFTVDISSSMHGAFHTANNNHMFGYRIPSSSFMLCPNLSGSSNTLELFKLDELYYDTLANVIQKIARNQPCTINCWGDSTTAGYGSTGYYDRTGVGEANYNIPGSYPNQLQILLRDIHNNNTLQVFNMGNAGKDTPFLYYNFDGIATPNPHPDLSILMIGLNDIPQPAYTADKYHQYLDGVIARLVNNGGAVVLMSTISFILNGELSTSGDIGRTPKVVQDELLNIQKNLAKKWGITFIDMFHECQKWFHKQRDPSGKQGVINSDELHYKDIGNVFVASVVAKELCSSIVRVDPSQFEAIAPWDGQITSQNNQARFMFNGTNNFPDANNHFGGGLIWVQADVAAGQDQNVLWMWNENPSALLRYHAMSNDGYQQTTAANRPNIIVSAKSYNNARVLENVPVLAAGTQTSLDNDPAENMQVICNLAYGLNKVEYNLVTAPPSTNGWMGFYSVVPDQRSIPYVSQGFLVPDATYQQVYTKTHSFGVDNRVSYGKDASHKTRLYLKGKFPKESGVILCEAPCYYFDNGYFQQTWGHGHDVRTGILLFRRADGTLGIFDVWWCADDTKKVALGNGANTTATPFTSDDYESIVDLYKDGSDNFVIDWYLNGATTPTLSRSLATTSQSSSVGGWNGSLFMDNQNAGTNPIEYASHLIATIQSPS